ncbi:MAG: outer membrane protein with a CnaB-type/M14 peptidase domain [Bacteroidetes bacterium]|jgi:hypothetical protein|nr:outer membrane protein with a CnaB-type/M14 peptidase domain [Bacteroidota bacterium]
MKRILFVFAASFSVIFSFAQQTCKGVLTDSTSGEPLEFANIGIIGKGVGTVTNEKGEYSFVVPDSLAKEKIKVSLIGYKSKTFTVAQVSALSKIVLRQDAVNLSEVAVTPKSTKVKTLGNAVTGSGVVAGFKKNNLGAELGVRLNIKHPQTHFRKFRVNIAKNSLDKAMFRLNIYSVDDKGLPKENILKQNIIIEPKEKTGLIEVDLRPYNIFVDDDVFVSLEWIKDLGDATGLMFSTKLVGSATYFRQASQDKWEKIAPLGVGLHVEVAY